MKLAHVDGEIEKLMDSLTGANNVLLSYFNSLSSSTLPSRQILSRS